MVVASICPWIHKDTILTYKRSWLNLQSFLSLILSADMTCFDYQQGFGDTDTLAMTEGTQEKI